MYSGYPYFLQACPVYNLVCSWGAYCTWKRAPSGGGGIIWQQEEQGKSKRVGDTWSWRLYLEVNIHLRTIIFSHKPLSFNQANGRKGTTAKTMNIGKLIAMSGDLQLKHIDEKDMKCDQERWNVTRPDQTKTKVLRNRTTWNRTPAETLSVDETPVPTVVAGLLTTPGCWWRR